MTIICHIFFKSIKYDEVDCMRTGICIRTIRIESESKKKIRIYHFSRKMLIKKIFTLIIINQL